MTDSYTENPVSQITTFGVGSSSTSGSNNLLGLDDGTDKMHSGILKALYATATGNYVYSVGANGIKQSDGGTYTSFTIDNDIKFYRNHEAYTITGTDMVVLLSAVADSAVDRYDMLVIQSFTDATCDITVDPTVTHNANSSIVAGLAVYGDGIPAGATIASITDTTHFELSIAATSILTNTTLTFSGLAIRNGTIAGTDSNVAALSANDVPVALIKVAAGTAADIVTRPLQLFTSVEEDRFLYTTGDAGGRVGIGTVTPTANLHIKSTTGTDNANPVVLVESSDAGAATGPELVLYRNSASVADNDAIGHLLFRGVNDNGTPQDVTYAQIYSKIGDMTDGTEDGTLFIRTIVNGTLQSRIEINNGELVINNGHLDSDFRVEADVETHAIFVDASKDGVGICTSGVDDNAQLTVGGSISLTEINVGGGASQPTASSAQGKIWTQDNNTLYFQDGAGTTKTISDSSNSLIHGLHTIWVPATAMYATTTTGCSALTQVEQTALRPELKVLDFAAGADDHAQFSIAMPKNWNEGVIQFQSFWTVTGTDTGLVAWGLTAQSVVNSGVTNTGFSALTTNTPLAHSGTSNDLMVSAASGNVTVLNAAADSVTYFMIARDVSAESADAQTAAARLIGIKILYTIDAGNDA